eukprot:628398-Rhodomonas_salina.2
MPSLQCSTPVLGPPHALLSLDHARSADRSSRHPHPQSAPTALASTLTAAPTTAIHITPPPNMLCGPGTEISLSDPGCNQHAAHASLRETPHCLETSPANARAHHMHTTLAVSRI